MTSSDLLKHLPTVGELLEAPQVKAVVGRLNEGLGQSDAVGRVRSFLDDLREEVSQRAEDLPLPSLREVIDRVARYVARDEGVRLRSAVNATGSFRGSQFSSTPLADAAAERVLLLSRDYGLAANASDIASDSAAADAIATLTRVAGAEAAAVFHSRAGALSLVLKTLGGRPRVVIARGEIGEVDPGCRLLDLAEATGVTLTEVGAPEAVTPDDYGAALGPQCAVLRVAPEGFRMVGATPRPSTAELAERLRSSQTLLVEDLGSAPLASLPEPGEAGGIGIAGIAAASASEALAAGADLVLLRGDGVVGGPPCTIVLGKRTLVEPLTQSPLAALHRPTAATLAALSVTVGMLDDPERAILHTPVLSLLSTPNANLATRAQRLAPQIAASPAVAAAEAVAIAAEAAPVGGLPFQAPSAAVAVTPAEGTAEELQARLAEATPVVVGRVEGGRLLLDLRTVFPRQDLTIVSAFPLPADEPSTDAASEA